MSNPKTYTLPKATVKSLVLKRIRADRSAELANALLQAAQADEGAYLAEVASVRAFLSLDEGADFEVDPDKCTLTLKPPAPIIDLTQAAEQATSAVPKPKAKRRPQLRAVPNPAEGAASA